MSKIYSVCLHTENFSYSVTNGAYTLRIRENDITLDKERMIEMIESIRDELHDFLMETKYSTGAMNLVSVNEEEEQ